MDKHNIMIADGNVSRRKKVIHTLSEDETLQLWESSNGMELLQKIEQHGTPDILFMSTTMPIINFRDFVQLYEDAVDCPVVLLYEQKREIQSIPSEIDHTLKSDFTEEELLSILEVALPNTQEKTTQKKSQLRVIFVDDEESILKSLKRSFRHAPIIQEFYTNGKDALEAMSAHECAVVVSDMRMPEMSGVDLLREIEQNHPDTIRMVLSGYSDEATIISAINDGHIWRYITKPWDENDLHIAVQNAIELYEERTQRVQLQKENRALKKEITSQNNSFIIGTSKEIQQLTRTIEKLARLDCTTLINGESGTGKELIASAIHYHGPRKKEPFIVVDCAAISPTVIESELFGYKKGAFTGAQQDKTGLIAQAGKGTLFLDEIGELPLDMQGRLLRVIQEKKIRAVGSNEYIPAEARIVAATNRDIPEEIKKGTFREDLYYRLNVVTLVSPPLRERLHDIPLLVEHFLNKHCNEVTGFKEFSTEAVTALQEYTWPGNVRELENTIIRSISLSDNEVIEEDELLLQPQTSAAAPINEEAIPELKTLEEFEIHAIKNALEIAKGNRRKAADIVGIGEATLYRKLKSYQLE